MRKMRRDLWESIPYRNEQEEREPQEPTLKNREWGTHTQNWTYISSPGHPAVLDAASNLLRPRS